MNLARRPAPRPGRWPDAMAIWLLTAPVFCRACAGPETQNGEARQGPSAQLSPSFGSGGDVHAPNHAPGHRAFHGPAED